MYVGDAEAAVRSAFALARQVRGYVCVHMCHVAGQPAHLACAPPRNRRPRACSSSTSWTPSSAPPLIQMKGAAATARRPGSSPPSSTSWTGYVDGGMCSRCWEREDTVAGCPRTALHTCYSHTAVSALPPTHTHLLGGRPCGRGRRAGRGRHQPAPGTMVMVMMKADVK